MVALLSSAALHASTSNATVNLQTGQLTVIGWSGFKVPSASTIEFLSGSVLTVDSGATVNGIQQPPVGGSTGQVLTKIDGTNYNYHWATPPSTGSVVGPVSSTDKAIARYNGTTGALIQDSGVTIDDTAQVFGRQFTATRTDGQYQIEIASASKTYGIAVSGMNWLFADVTTGTTLLAFDGSHNMYFSFLTTNGYVKTNSASGLTTVETLIDLTADVTGTLPAFNLPVGSSSAFGVIKVDGTSIISTGGILSAVTGGSGNMSASGSITANYLGIWAGPTSMKASQFLPAANVPAFTGDMTTSAGSLTTTVVSVNGVSYAASPSTNTVAVVTGTNATTYEAVPNTALAHSSVTIGSTSVALGATVTSFSGVTLVTPTISGAISFPAGTRQTFSPNTTTPGVNVGSVSGDPASPSNGDFWYDSTGNLLRTRINGITVSLGAAAAGTVTTTGSPANTYLTYFTGSTSVSGNSGATEDMSGNITAASLKLGATGLSSVTSTDLAIAAASGQVVQVNSNMFFRNQTSAIFALGTSTSANALYINFESGGVGGVIQTFGLATPITIEGLSISFATGSGAALNVVSTTAIQMPHYGAGTATFDSAGNITSSSDARLKNIDRPFTRGLEAITALHPQMYHWKEGTGLDTKTAYAGFIAQDVQAAIPEAVGVMNDGTGHLTLADRPITAALVNSVREMQEEIVALRKQLQACK